MDILQNFLFCVRQMKEINLEQRMMKDITFTNNNVHGRLTVLL